jgi:hypothetical protein
VASEYDISIVHRVIKSGRMRGAGHVTRMGERVNPYVTVVGKPEGKIPLTRPRCKLDNNIKMVLEVVV